MSLEYLGAFLLDDIHLGLEHLFKVVGAHDVVIGVAATVDVFLQLLFALGDVQLVEYRLQQVYFVFLRVFFTVSNFLHAVEHFLLRGVDFLFSLFLSNGLLSGCFLSGCFLCYGLLDGCFLGYRLLSCRLLSGCFLGCRLLSWCFLSWNLLCRCLTVGYYFLLVCKQGKCKQYVIDMEERVPSELLRRCLVVFSEQFQVPNRLSMIAQAVG